MALKIIGKGTFGVEAEGESGQSLTVSESCEEVTLKNKDGEFLGVALVSMTTEKTYEVAATDGSEPPEIGGSFLEGTVTARTKTSGNAQFATWSVTVKKWGSLGASASA